VTLVGDVVGDLVIDNQLVLAIDGNLDVVAYLYMMAPSDGHRTGIRIGQGDLRLAGFDHLLVNTFQVLFAVLQVVDDFLEFFGGLFAEAAFLFVVFVELLEIPVDPWPSPPGQASRRFPSSGP
jgi:hypothetical protein